MLSQEGIKKTKEEEHNFFYCTCAVCGSNKVKYVKENGQVGTGRKTGKGRKTKRKSKN